MPRTERLLALMQQLRTRRRPQQAQALAQSLGVSLRTLYRDIDTLRAQGADIRGEPGIGYVLKKGGPTLPPLMFSESEIEALVLGLRWVSARADAELAASARSVLTKVEAVLPARLAPLLEDQALYPVSSNPAASAVHCPQPHSVAGTTTSNTPAQAPRRQPIHTSSSAAHENRGHTGRPPTGAIASMDRATAESTVHTGQPATADLSRIDRVAAELTAHAGQSPTTGADTTGVESALLPTIRQALRENRQLQMDYTDAQGTPSQRTLWPVALGYFETTRLLAAWCTLRQDFRHFRTDRIRQVWLGEPCPKPRRLLEAEWLQATGISLDRFRDRD